MLYCLLAFLLLLPFTVVLSSCKIGWSQGKPRVGRRKKPMFLFSLLERIWNQELKWKAETLNNPPLTVFIQRQSLQLKKFHWSIDIFLSKERERRLHLFQEDKLYLKTNSSAPGWAAHADSAGCSRRLSSSPCGNPGDTEPLGSWGTAPHLPPPQFLNVKQGTMASSSAFWLYSKCYRGPHLSPHLMHGTSYNKARNSLEPVNISVSTMLITHHKRPSYKDSLGT